MGKTLQEEAWEMPLLLHMLNCGLNYLTHSYTIVKWLISSYQSTYFIKLSETQNELILLAVLYILLLFVQFQGLSIWKWLLIQEARAYKTNLYGPGIRSTIHLFEPFCCPHNCRSAHMMKSIIISRSIISISNHKLSSSSRTIYINYSVTCHLSLVTRQHRPCILGNTKFYSCWYNDTRKLAEYSTELLVLN